MRISLSSLSVCTSASRLLAIELDHLAGSIARARTSARRPESMFTSPVNSPGPWTVTTVVHRAGRPDDLHAARRDDEERHGRLADLEEDLAGPDRAPSSVPGHAGDLRRRERREHLLGAAWADECGRRRWFGHSPAYRPPRGVEQAAGRAEATPR